MTVEQVVSESVSTYLFWARIMKEHAIFIQSALPPPQAALAAQAEDFRRQFTRFLSEAVRLAGGVLPKETLESGQFYTDYTDTVERDFQKQIGIETNSGVTILERSIRPIGAYVSGYSQLRQRLADMNRRLLAAVEAFIRYQADLLNVRCQCGLAAMLYPSALRHLLSEAKRFREELLTLSLCNEAEPGGAISFWNRGMSEHAKSLRGQLDWVEEEHIRTANDFANAYDELSAASPNRERALAYTLNFSEFAAEVTRGTVECRLLGIMSSLYTDHLLREVNHYRFLLQS